MDLNFNIVKPIWYIEQETLVAILLVIKDLEEDIRRKIVKIITLRNKKEEERYNAINYNFFMDTSDYYLSE